MPAEKKFASGEIEAFNNLDQYYWKVASYGGKPPKSEISRTPVFERHWYSVDGKAQADLKKGDKILVAHPVKNRHRLAFSLAIDHTVKEIEKLYAASDGMWVGGLALREVFLMDLKDMAGAGVQYDKRTAKNGSGGS